jgi:hypothetical protein
MNSNQVVETISLINRATPDQILYVLKFGIQAVNEKLAQNNEPNRWALNHFQIFPKAESVRTVQQIEQADHRQAFDQILPERRANVQEPTTYADKVKKNLPATAEQTEQIQQTFEEMNDEHISDEDEESVEQEVPTVRQFCGNEKCDCFYTKSYKNDPALNDVGMIDQNGLFIAGLPKQLHYENVRSELCKILKGIFIKHTNVPASIDEDEVSGNKGTAFMEFNSHKDAVRAWKLLKSKRLFGQDSKVNFRVNVPEEYKRSHVHKSRRSQ